MTGINIPDMIKIVEEHGCVAVPFDFNIDTMCPSDLDDIKRLTPDKVRPRPPPLTDLFLDQGSE